VTDALVIGAGPNGLVAANLLADAGWSVTVLEAAPTVGGSVRSGEITAPGFISDLYSAQYPLGAVSPIFAALQLEQHGLTWSRAPAVLAHPTVDGPTAVIDSDLAGTQASLDRFAGGDGSAWRDLYGRWERVGDELVASLLSPFPPVAPAAKLAAKLGPKGLLELTRTALLPVRRLGEEAFKGEGGRLLLAGNALHADFTPEATGSGFFGWLMCALAQQVGFPVVRGGAQELPNSLVRRLDAKGGTVRTGAPVTKVVVEGGRAIGVELASGESLRAAKAVIADTDAVKLYRELVGDQHLAYAFLKGLERFQRGSSTIKVDWALDGPIPWADEAISRAGTVHIADSIDELTLTSAQLAMGLVPANPFLLLGQMTTCDTTRSPAGTECVWSYTHVPQEVRGDAGGGSLDGRWDASQCAEMADRMEARIERLAPGFRGRVIARHVVGPVELERENANLVGGDVGGGTAQLHQQLVFRPVPGLGGPGTPIKGLYLGSASAHPGGGVHGACGANAAKAALLRERLPKRVAVGAAVASAAALGRHRLRR
jgi:phytoene dehydrogenase-like protein